MVFGGRRTSATHGKLFDRYLNANGQVVIGNTGAPETDKNQYVYQLACSQCGTFMARTAAIIMSDCARSARMASRA